MSDVEQRIRDRAYQLWEQAGRPHEQSQAFWHAARQEIEGETPPPADRADGATASAPQTPATEPAPSRKTRAARAVATPAARKASVIEEEAAPSRRPRTGAARPPASRPPPSRPR
jgi:hypothetical protein